MYSRREKRLQVECIDLDPYGTVSPFIDAAVQAVSDGGEFLQFSAFTPRRPTGSQG